MNLFHQRGALVLAFASLVLPVMAQTDNPPPPASADGQDQTPPPPRRARGERRIRELTAKLGLTDAQVQQVKGIMKAQMQQARAVREDDSLSDDDRRAQMMQLMKTAHDQVRAILTPDQQKIYDAMPPPGMGRHGGAGGPPPPPT